MLLCGPTIAIKLKKVQISKPINKKSRPTRSNLVNLDLLLFERFLVKK